MACMNRRPTRRPLGKNGKAARSRRSFAACLPDASSLPTPPAAAAAATAAETSAAAPSTPALLGQGLKFLGDGLLCGL